jgi:hypothetical protein
MREQCTRSLRAILQLEEERMVSISGGGEAQDDF